MEQKKYTRIINGIQINCIINIRTKDELKKLTKIKNPNFKLAIQNKKKLFTTIEVNPISDIYETVDDFLTEIIENPDANSQIIYVVKDENENFYKPFTNESIVEIIDINTQITYDRALKLKKLINKKYKSLNDMYEKIKETIEPTDELLYEIKIKEKPFDTNNANEKMFKISVSDEGNNSMYHIQTVEHNNTIEIKDIIHYVWNASDIEGGYFVRV